MARPKAFFAVVWDGQKAGYFCLAFTPQGRIVGTYPVDRFQREAVYWRAIVGIRKLVGREFSLEFRAFSRTIGSDPDTMILGRMR